MRVERRQIASAKLDIRTQFHALPVGRPDMLITLAGVPWFLFENKVGHTVSERVYEVGDRQNPPEEPTFNSSDWLPDTGHTFIAIPSD